MTLKVSKDRPIIPHIDYGKNPSTDKNHKNQLYAVQLLDELAPDPNRILRGVATITPLYFEVINEHTSNLSRPEQQTAAAPATPLTLNK
jgi:hypothetical protein